MDVAACFVDNKPFDVPSELDSLAVPQSISLYSNILKYTNLLISIYNNAKERIKQCWKCHWVWTARNKSRRKKVEGRETGTEETGKSRRTGNKKYRKGI